MTQRQNKLEVIYSYMELMETELKLRFGGDPTSKDILRHLIERGMINPKRLRNYMIIADFDNRLKFNKGNSTHTFMDLSIKYNISESQTQNVVYKERKKAVAAQNISY